MSFSSAKRRRLVTSSLQDLDDVEDVVPGRPSRSRLTPRPSKKQQGAPAKETPKVVTFKSKDGTKFTVNGGNKFLPFMGKVLGNGATALVVEDNTDRSIVYKIVQDPKSIELETYMQQLCACVNVAPQIYDLHDNVLKMQRIEMLKEYPNEIQQQQVVELVARMVAVGLIHNDLHLGNIGKLPDGMILIDFGLTEKIEGALMSDIVFLQVVLAQLYALIDPCNHNNPGLSSDSEQCGETSVFVNYIYAIRNHDHKNELIRLLLRVREDAVFAFNRNGCNVIGTEA